MTPKRVPSPDARLRAAQTALQALTCPDCGQTYAAVAGHCRAGHFGGCCRSWATSRAHEAHLTGSYLWGRRCMSTAELYFVGFRQDERGRWADPKTIEERMQ